MENILFRNIMHIDDDVNSHEFFSDALYEVSKTSKYYAFVDAKDALKTLLSKKLSPDVIFLDLNLSKMSGQEFLVEIKKHEDFKDIPVVILSGSMHKGTIELVKILGAKAFIKKHWSQQIFIQILSAILSFNFLMNSEFVLSSAEICKKYNGFQGMIPEEIFAKDVTDRGVYLN